MATEQQLTQAEQQAKQIISTPLKERKYGAGIDVENYNKQLTAQKEQAKAVIQNVQEIRQQQAQQQAQEQRARDYQTLIEKAKQGSASAVSNLRQHYGEEAAKIGASLREQALASKGQARSTGPLNVGTTGKTYRYSNRELRSAGVEAVVSVDTGRTIALRDIKTGQTISASAIQNTQAITERSTQELEREQSLISPTTKVIDGKLTISAGEISRPSTGDIIYGPDNKVYLQIGKKKIQVREQVVKTPGLLSFGSGAVKSIASDIALVKELSTTPPKETVSSIYSALKKVSPAKLKTKGSEYVEQFKSQPFESAGALTAGLISGEVFGRIFLAPIKFLREPVLVKIDPERLAKLSSKADIANIIRGEESMAVAQFTVLGTKEARYGFVAPNYEVILRKFAGIGKTIPGELQTYEQLSSKYSRGQKILIEPPKAGVVITEPLVIKEGIIQRALAAERSPGALTQTLSKRKSPITVSRLGGDIERFTTDYERINLDKLSNIDRSIIKQLEKTESIEFLKSTGLDIGKASITQGFKPGTTIQFGNIVTADITKILSTRELKLIEYGKTIKRSRLGFAQRQIAEVNFEKEFGLTSLTKYEETIGAVDVTRPRFRAGKITEIKGITNVAEINQPIPSTGFETFGEKLTKPARSEQTLKDLQLNLKAVNEAIAGAGIKLGERFKPRISPTKSIAKAIEQVTPKISPIPSKISRGAFTGLGLYERTSEVSATQLQLQFATISPTPALKTPTREIEILRNLISNTPKEITREVTRTVPREIIREIPKTTVREVPKIIPKLIPRTVTRTTIKPPAIFPPTTKTPQPSRSPPRIISKPKKEIKSGKQKGVSVSIRRLGKEFEIGAGLTPEEAKSLGFRAIEKSLARSVIFRGVGSEKITLPTFYARRPTKTSKLRGLGNIFIEKSRYALSTASEKKAIQAAKRRKKK